MISLPIPASPDRDQRTTYTKIRYDDDSTIVDLLEKMGKSKIKLPEKGEKSAPPKLARNLPAHLDPDLRQESLKRKTGWRGLFGINRKSQTHIEREIEKETKIKGKSLEPGDLFLFFGWFEKYAYEGSKKLVKVRNRKDYRTGRHVIFGYLQIDTILKLFEMKKNDPRIENWMLYHPHIGEGRRMVGDSARFDKNTMYVGRKTLDFAPEKPGFGLFRYEDDSAEHITLTKKGCTKTQWELPQAFTTPKQVTISHSPNGWQTWKKEGYFQLARTYGQEFVIEERPEIENGPSR
jgi:hypothetical protein